VGGSSHSGKTIWMPCTAPAQVAIRARKSVDRMAVEIETAKWKGGGGGQVGWRSSGARPKRDRMSSEPVIASASLELALGPTTPQTCLEASGFIKSFCGSCEW